LRADKPEEFLRRNRERHAQRRYGLSLEEIRAGVALQGGVCCLCRRPLDRVVVDHCHRTGKVRGFVCYRCNTGLGLFDDDPLLIRRALEHLLKDRFFDGSSVLTRKD